MAKRGRKRPIEKYEHADKERLNNPPVGLVTPETDPDPGQKKTYAYDPHLDPQLVWAGKAEHTSFDVPTVLADGPGTFPGTPVTSRIFWRDIANRQQRRDFVDEQELLI